MPYLRLKPLSGSSQQLQGLVLTNSSPFGICQSQISVLFQLYFRYVEPFNTVFMTWFTISTSNTQLACFSQQLKWHSSHFIKIIFNSGLKTQVPWIIPGCLYRKNSAFKNSQALNKKSQNIRSFRFFLGAIIQLFFEGKFIGYILQSAPYDGFWGGWNKIYPLLYIYCKLHPIYLSFKKENLKRFLICIVYGKRKKTNILKVITLFPYTSDYQCFLANIQIPFLCCTLCHCNCVHSWKSGVIKKRLRKKQ